MSSHHHSYLLLPYLPILKGDLSDKGYAMIREPSSDLPL